VNDECGIRIATALQGEFSGSDGRDGIMFNDTEYGSSISVRIEVFSAFMFYSIRVRSRFTSGPVMEHGRAS
jgi:hypothetical protein